MEDDTETTRKNEPSSTSDNRDNSKPDLDLQVSTRKGRQSPDKEQSAGSNGQENPQPEDPEELKLKEEISKILEEKARLKKELSDLQPPGNSYVSPSNS